MHSHHNNEESLGREILQVIPFIGPVFNSKNKNILQKTDAVLLETVEIGGQIVAMYAIPSVSWGGHDSMNMGEMRHEMHHMHMQMGINEDIQMGIKMWLGGAGARLLYNLCSKPIRVMIEKCAQESFEKESWGTWFKKKILGSVPLVGAFFWAETKLQAIAYNISNITMIVAGTAIVVLTLDPETSMDLKPEDVALTSSVMIAGMTASMLAEIPVKRAFSFCTSKCGFWQQPKATDDEIPLLLIDNNEADALEIEDEAEKGINVPGSKF